mgnify:CR=1 FL=1
MHIHIKTEKKIDLNPPTRSLSLLNLYNIYMLTLVMTISTHNSCLCFLFFPHLQHSQQLQSTLLKSACGRRGSSYFTVCARQRNSILPLTLVDSIENVSRWTNFPNTRGTSPAREGFCERLISRKY